MKYTLVKQFSNSAIDNIFKFFFKWVDFAKMAWEFVLSFMEIWMAFFLIFYNIFMYVYYLLLFFIDRGSESGGGIFRIRGTYTKSSYVPRVAITSGPNPVSPRYGGARAVSQAAQATVIKTADTAAQALTSLRGSVSASGAKKSIVKTILNGIAEFFIFLGNALIKPFKMIIEYIDRKRTGRPDKDEKEAAGAYKSKSLIDEYMREYEQKKR